MERVADVATQFRPTHRAGVPELLLWSEPGAVRSVTGQVPGGTDLELLESGGGWARVRRADGSTGWVDAGQLRARGRPLVRSRWFAGIAGVVVLALLAGGVFFYLRARTQPSSSSSSSTPSSMSTAQLLNQAYQSGRIDRPTWLRYRIYSMFGVESLPGEYRTGTVNANDEAVAAELQLGDPLPSDTRAELMSYLEPPTTPGSVFYGAGPVALPAAAITGIKLAGTVVCDANNFTTRASDHFPFRVWARCTAGYEGRLTTVFNMLEALWPPMTQLMGNPIPGGDGYTDIYLIPRDVRVSRGSDIVKIDGLNEAVTIAAAPFRRNASSGYIFVDEAATSQPGLRSTIVHEFFHVLEYAHNYRAHWERVRLHIEENWFPEASSVWAESYFARSSAATNVYPKAIDFLNHIDMPLDTRGPSGTPEWHHIYEAFLWLYFIEQEAGAQTIGNIWSSPAMEDATDGTQALAVFDNFFPFHTFFNRFALRNLNDPSFGPAIGKLYQALDPKFPDTPQDATPVVPPRSGSMFIQQQDPNAAPATQLSVNVDHLLARYYSVSLDSDVDQVSLNMSLAAGGGALQASLIVLPLSANPVPRLVSLVPGTETKLCDVKQIERGILVVTNDNLNISGAATITAKGTTQPCAPKLAVTSVTPSSVQEDATSTIIIKGTGFTTPGLIIDVSITASFNPGIQCPCSIPPQPVLKIVSDTEIDYTAEFSTSAPPGAYDVNVFDDSSVGAPMPIQAACTGCLTLTALP